MKPFLSILLCLLCGCASTRETSSIQGLRILSEIGLSRSQIETLDNGFSWALAHGLKAEANHVTVKVVKGELTPGGSYGIPTIGSPTGYAGGRTLSFNPIIIELPVEHLDNLSHEFMHIILWQKTGDSDGNHSLPIWKQLGLF